MLGWTVLAVILGGIAAAILLWALAYRELTYTLADTGLEIAWYGHIFEVPYASIEGIYTGQRLVGSSTPTVPTWPGIYVGPGRAPGMRRLRFFTTSPDPSNLTLIASEHAAVAVSASDPQAFRTALIERVQAVDASSTASVAWSRRAEGRAPWTSVRDPWLIGSLGVSLLLLVVLLGSIAAGFASLPAEIPLRFDASGQPMHIGPAEDLLRLPLVGSTFVLLNAGIGVWLHARERYLARMLWLGGCVVLALLLIATLRFLA
jgi:hypothetical protein